MEVLAWAHGRILGPGVLVGRYPGYLGRTYPAWVLGGSLFVLFARMGGWVDGW